MKRLDGYVQATGASGEQVQQILSVIGSLPGNPKIYAEWKIKVVNGKLVGDVNKITVGNLDLPQDQIQANKDTILSAIQNRLDELHIKVNSITVSNGVLNLDGTIPAQVSLAPP
jgi:hypothetical protein